MQLIRGQHNLRPQHRGCAVTIGAFDGVHLGHQAVLAHLKRQAQLLEIPTAVVTFEPLPREYLTPLEAPYWRPVASTACYVCLLMNASDNSQPGSL